jgi:hypothetical protein
MTGLEISQRDDRARKLSTLMMRIEMTDDAKTRI